MGWVWHDIYYVRSWVPTMVEVAFPPRCMSYVYILVCTAMTDRCPSSMTTLVHDSTAWNWPVSATFTSSQPNYRAYAPPPTTDTGTLRSRPHPEPRVFETGTSTAQQSSARRSTASVSRTAATLPKNHVWSGWHGPVSRVNSLLPQW